MTMSAAILKPPSLLRRLPWRTISAIAFLLALGLFLFRGAITDWWELHQALDLMEERQFPMAQPMLLHILERHPDNVAVNRALAMGYLHSTRQLAETRKYLDRWCDLDPRSTEAFKERLSFWMMQEMVAPAIHDAQQVLELDPNAAETRGRLVQLLLTAGRYKEAEKEGLQSFKGDPHNVQLWFVLANIYHGLGQEPGGAVARERAEALIDQVLRVNPEHLAALKFKAKLYLQAGQTEQAIHLLREKVVGAPGSDGTLGLYELSEALTRAGRDAEAKKVMAELEWQQMLGLWSRHEYRDQNLGLITRVAEAMLATDKVDDAVKFLLGILQRNPASPPAVHRLLAECYDRQQRPELAQEQRRLAKSEGRVQP